MLGAVCRERLIDANLLAQAHFESRHSAKERQTMMKRFLDSLAPTERLLAFLLALCLSNVWLVMQNVRWFVYSDLVSRQLLKIEWAGSFNLLLEIPGIVAAMVATYLLVIRLAYNVWKYRGSMFGREIIARGLSICSGLLLLLTAVGVMQWLIAVEHPPLDLVVVALIGFVSVGISYVLERRLVKP